MLPCKDRRYALVQGFDDVLSYLVLSELQLDLELAVADYKFTGSWNVNGRGIVCETTDDVIPARQVEQQVACMRISAVKIARYQNERVVMAHSSDCRDGVVQLACAGLRRTITAQLVIKVSDAAEDAQEIGRAHV